MGVLHNPAASMVASFDLVLFYSPTCDACSATRKRINDELVHSRRIEFVAVDTTLGDARTIRDAFNERYNVPARQAEAVPALFWQDGYIVGARAIDSRICEVVATLSTKACQK